MRNARGARAERAGALACASHAILGGLVSAKRKKKSNQPKQNKRDPPMSSSTNVRKPPRTNRSRPPWSRNHGRPIWSSTSAAVSAVSRRSLRGVVLSDVPKNPKRVGCAARKRLLKQALSPLCLSLLFVCYSVTVTVKTCRTMANSSCNTLLKVHAQFRKSTRNNRHRCGAKLAILYGERVANLRVDLRNCA